MPVDYKTLDPKVREALIETLQFILKEFNVPEEEDSKVEQILKRYISNLKAN